MIDRFMPYLEDLEGRIESSNEEEFWALWKDYADGKSYTPIRGFERQSKPSAVQWPEITLNDTLSDIELMIISQFKQCSEVLGSKSKRLMYVRANYGVGIIPSLFGCRPFVMREEANTLPNIYPLDGAAERLSEIIEKKLDMNDGWGEKVFAAGRIFKEIRANFPRIARTVRFSTPDFQGPIDLCELIVGSDMFYLFYDEPELIKRLLRRVSDVYIDCLEHWHSVLAAASDYGSYLGKLHRGPVSLRDDSATNLSPEIYEEFIRPYDEYIFSRLGGGSIHFCGKGDHFIEMLSETKGLCNVDMSQPHLNDFEHILTHTADKGINLTTALSERELSQCKGKHDFDRVCTMK